MTFGSGPGTAGASGVEPAADYDRFVDWDKRLAREAPFFRLMFAEHDVHRVIDVGCGTGKHAAMWASCGLDVVGVDPSESMLAQARVNRDSAAEAIEEAGGSLDLLVGRFGELAATDLGPADAVTCTGNGLPHVDGLAGLREAVRDFAAVLRPGGVCVLHLLNHDRLLACPDARDPPGRARRGRRHVGVPACHGLRPREGIGFDFVTLHRPAGTGGRAVGDGVAPLGAHRASRARCCAANSRRRASSEIRLFGDHESKPFDAATDESVIVVAVRG